VTRHDLAHAFATTKGWQFIRGMVAMEQCKPGEFPTNYVLRVSTITETPMGRPILHGNNNEDTGEAFRSALAERCIPDLDDPATRLLVFRVLSVAGAAVKELPPWVAVGLAGDHEGLQDSALSYCLDVLQAVRWDAPRCGGRLLYRHRAGALFEVFGVYTYRCPDCGVTGTTERPRVVCGAPLDDLPLVSWASLGLDNVPADGVP